MGLMHELKAAGITTLSQLKVALGLVALGPDKDFGKTGQIMPGQQRRVVLAKVTSAASGGGKYNGKIVTSSTSTITATGDLAEADLGTLPSADNCLILNGAESGKSTHDLTTGTPVAKIFVGVLLAQRSTTGIFVVVINGLDPETCT